MKPKQAIHILMLSPCYWLLNPAARKELIREFCAHFEKVDREYDQQMKKMDTQPTPC